MENPQHEVYTTRHEFGNGAAVAAGTSVTQTIYTNQANNESSLRPSWLKSPWYGAGTNGSNGHYICSCDAIDTQPTCTDFDGKILVGANQVPSQSFSITSIACKDDKTLTFQFLFLVLFQQPLSVVVTNNTACGLEYRTIKVTLVSELAIQSVIVLTET